jgi:hypothetical protein
MVTVNLQETSSTATAPPLSWRIVFLPLIALQASLLLTLLSLAWGAWRGSVTVTHPAQWAIWGAYLCALMFSGQAVWLMLNLSVTHDNNIIVLPRDSTGVSMTAHPLAVCWFLSVSLFVLGLVATFHMECRNLSRSRGFSSPIPLVKNAIGTYEPRATYQQQGFSVIGTIRNTHSCPSHVSYKGARRSLGACSGGGGGGGGGQGTGVGGGGGGHSHQRGAKGREDLSDSNMVVVP